jgi:hypothetical protein
MRTSRLRATPPVPAWTPEDLGLDPARYQAMLRHLFDRPVPQGQEQAWYWDVDEPDFAATPLEWTRFQTILFANAGTHLADFSDDQVGMGLYVVMDNGQSEINLAATDASVPLVEAMRMMQAMPGLWRDCLGPRLAGLHAPIGSAAGGRLGHACYMWFDCWYTFYRVREQPAWRDAMWTLLSELLAQPFREAQVAALHGIGHNVMFLDRQPLVDDTLHAFIGRTDPDDGELRRYAEAARRGMVQ